MLYKLVCGYFYDDNRMNTIKKLINYFSGYQNAKQNKTNPYK